MIDDPDNGHEGYTYFMKDNIYILLSVAVNCRGSARFTLVAVDWVDINAILDFPVCSRHFGRCYIDSR